MSASDSINKITKWRRGQDRKGRIDYVFSQAPDRAKKLNDCGNQIYLREWIQTGESRVVKAMLCFQPLLCEFCAVRRQGKLYSSALPKVQHIRDSRPELKMVHLTVTTKAGHDLKERDAHLRKSWSSMLAAVRRTNSAKCHHKRKLELGKVAGMIRSFETKPSDKGHGWLCHLHAFCFVTDWIDVEKLSAEWLEVTGDSKIVHVREVHAKDEESGEIESGLSEVLKYPLKFAGLDPADSWKAFLALQGKRMTDSSGILRGITAGDISSDDDLEQDGPYRDFIASWLNSQQRYDLRPIPTGPLSFKGQHIPFPAHLHAKR